MKRDEEKLKWFLWYIKTFMGKPYKWGGDDSMAGFDCSGLVIEGLKGIGEIGEKVDMTASGLYKYFERTNPTSRVDEPYEGCLMFVVKNLSIVHVEICVSDNLAIGADGGGSHIRTEDDAIAHNAFIKLRPINRWSSCPKLYIDPFKREE